MPPVCPFLYIGPLSSLCQLLLYNTIEPICVYSVKGKTRVNENIDDETFGMLFIADINSFEELHSEIEKILISDKLVENWTYPLIQPILIEEAKKRGFI